MTLMLEIISPEKLLVSKPVDMVVIPGTEGDLGILPGHAKLITSLRGGLVDLYEDKKITDRFFVTAGFAEITGERVSVLADKITRQADLDPTQAAEDLQEARDAFAAADMSNPTTYRERSDALIAAQAMVDSLPGPTSGA